jgi:peptidoglycan/LPS O-acetylase OafA/YrhL
MEKITPSINRSAPLDALRALAVLLVLGGHFPETPAGWKGAPKPAWMELWERCGWIGVDLFFVLSGFLVSGLLFREYGRFGEIRYGHFLARRGFKIYPAFYFMLGTLLLYSAHMGRPSVGWPVFLSEMFFVQNYGPSLFPHTWSLAIEEHFYLLLPLLLLAVRGKKDRAFSRLPQLFIGVAVLALGARIGTTLTLDFRYKTHLFPTHLRIDSLLFGVLLSWATHFMPEVLENVWTRFRWLFAIAAAALVAPVLCLQIGNGWYLQTIGLTGLYIASGVLLMFALRWKSTWPPLAFIGAYSYSIYLWHIPVRFFGLAWVPSNAAPLTRSAAYLASAIVFGIVAAWVVERPFLALRDRLFPTRSQSVASWLRGSLFDSHRAVDAEMPAFAQAKMVGKSGTLCEARFSTTLPSQDRALKS